MVLNRLNKTLLPYGLERELRDRQIRHAILIKFERSTALERQGVEHTTGLFVKCHY